MNSRDFSVRGLRLDTPAGEVAFDAVFSDVVRVLKTKEVEYDEQRIHPPLYNHLNLRDKAQAYLTVFDRWRACLTRFRDFNVKEQDVQRMFMCPPTGAVLAPPWPYVYRCRQMVCPWCTYLQALQLAQEPWAPLNQEVHLYVRQYDTPRPSELTETHKAAARDRRNFVRRAGSIPSIRFHRLGLELVDGVCVYRRMLMVALEQPVAKYKGWDYKVGTYGGALSVAFRYSGANLLLSKYWDYLSWLVSIKRLRRYEISRLARSR